VTATVARASTGRRLYTPEFKQQQIERVERREISAAELSGKLGITRSMTPWWNHLATRDRSRPSSGSRTTAGCTRRWRRWSAPSASASSRWRRICEARLGHLRGLAARRIVGPLS